MFYLKVLLLSYRHLKQMQPPRVKLVLKLAEQKSAAVQQLPETLPAGLPPPE
ncbi:MAG: hypothetical protein M1536_08960 [Firmicutes bacterium]|nr:hypothetical protein [Bacillota bacterium]